MAIQFLGAMPEKRPSDLAGLRGITKEFKEDKIKAREKQADRDATYKAALMNSELDAKAKTVKHLRSAYQNYWNLPDDQRQMFDDSDKGKAFQKRLKQDLSAVFDNNGELIPMPKEKVPDWAKDPAQFLKMKEDVARVMAKVEAEQPFNASDLRVLTKFADDMQFAGEAFGYTKEDMKELGTQIKELIARSGTGGFNPKSIVRAGGNENTEALAGGFDAGSWLTREGYE